MMNRRTLLGVTVAVLAAVGCATSAGAMTYTVRCGGPSPGEYGTITAALNAAKAASPRDHTINVYGSCTETVNISALDYVRIVGQEGASLSYPSPVPPSQPVLSLNDTRSTEITNLTVLGLADVNVDVVRIFYSTKIRFTKVTVSRSGGTGVFVNQGSTVLFTGCVISGHAVEGVKVSAGSVATFGENANASPETATFVQDNGGSGINGTQNSHLLLGGNVSVLNNGGNGVAATDSTIYTCCNTGERVISGNRNSGIAVTGGTFRNNGTLLVANNGGYGVNLVASYGHLNPNAGSSLTIRDNAGYGVLAYRNSTVDIYDALIEDNQGGGVLMLDSSAARISGSTIQYNGDVGVGAYVLSVALISSGNTITGNVGFDLFCTPDSTGRGTKDGVGKVFCAGFNKFPAPDPGPIR
jgi:hypothetical protein